MVRGRGKEHRIAQASKPPKKSLVQYVELPISLVIRGVPVSLQGDNAYKKEWKDYVTAAFKGHPNVRGRTHLTRGVSLKVTLSYYYAGWRTDLDVDNFVKPMLDAGNKVVWHDDAQILDLHVFKRSISRVDEVEVMDPEFATAFSAGQDFVYVVVETSLAREF